MRINNPLQPSAVRQTKLAEACCERPAALFACFDPPPRVRYRSDGQGGVLLDAPFPMTLTLRQAQRRLEHLDGRRQKIAADPATVWRTRWFDNIVASLLSATASAERYQALAREGAESVRVNTKDHVPSGKGEG